MGPGEIFMRAMSWVKDWGLLHVLGQSPYLQILFFLWFASTWNSNCNLLNFACFVIRQAVPGAPHFLLLAYAEGSITCY